MKIGIVTISDYKNYGNRLQNYALEQTLKKISNDFEIYSITEKRSLKLSKKYLLKNAIYIPKFLKRYKNFIKFDSLYVNTIEVNKKIFDKDVDKKFDCFIVGSDQIFNPHWQKYFHFENSFLRFTNLEKRIAYAPSFGVDEIPDEFKEQYALALNEFKYLSAREIEGKRIIKELTNKNVEVLLDPALLLSKEEWLEVTNTKKYKDKYILLYFLGNLTKENENYINSLKEKFSYKVYNLLDVNGPFYTSGPSEFLGLINNAEIIISDSYHALIFSIIFNKPFKHFNRVDSIEDMSCRFRTLINKLDLNLDEDPFEIDYSNAYKVIEQEKEKSIKYLKEALNETIN